MSIQKKHHFVPITYLNNFVVDETLWTLEMELVKKYPNVKPQPKSPSQICKAENFYFIDDIFKTSNPQFQHLNPLFVENEVFRRIEMNFQKIFRLIVDNKTLSFEEANLIADLILQFKIRNPFYRREINSRREKIITSVETQLKSDNYYKQRFGRIPVVIKDYIFSNYVAQNQNVEAFGKNLQLSFLISREFTNRNDIVKAAILQSTWHLLDGCYSNIPFITTDNPGISVTTPFDGLVYNTKFTDNFKFYLPLSPRYCLLLKGGAVDMNFFYTNKKLLNSYYCNPLTIIGINDQIMKTYNKYIISSEKSYLDEVAKVNGPKA